MWGSGAALLEGRREFNLTALVGSSRLKGLRTYSMRSRRRAAGVYLFLLWSLLPGLQ